MDNLEFYKNDTINSTNEININPIYINNKIDINYFETIDCISKSYFLEFILGDGHISLDGRLAIGINPIDIEILEKFKIELNCNNPITAKTYFDSRYQKEYHTVFLRFSNKKLLNDLKSHGITNNKSKDCKISSLIPDNLISHFIRGLFDADGCWTWSDSAQRHLRFTIGCSTETFALEVQEILIKKCFITKSKIIPNKNKTCFVIMYSGNNQTKKIYDYLYNNHNNYYLTRKYNRSTSHIGNL